MKKIIALFVAFVASFTVTVIAPAPEASAQYYPDSAFRTIYTDSFPGAFRFDLAVACRPRGVYDGPRAEVKATITNISTIARRATYVLVDENNTATTSDNVTVQYQNSGYGPGVAKSFYFEVQNGEENFDAGAWKGDEPYLSASKIGRRDFSLFFTCG